MPGHSYSSAAKFVHAQVSGGGGILALHTEGGDIPTEFRLPCQTQVFPLITQVVASNQHVVKSPFGRTKPHPVAEGHDAARALDINTAESMNKIWGLKLSQTCGAPPPKKLQ